MAITKRKTYFYNPTCKQINAILSQGWRITSVNSASCHMGNVTSVLQDPSDNFTLCFEQCDGGEEYYCLQRFLYYSLWSKEEYANAIAEIEEYRKQGACIIATLSVGRVGLTLGKQIVPPMLSVLGKDKVEILYYIIIPKNLVRDCDEEYSFDAMLSYLGFRVHPVMCRIGYWICVFWAGCNAFIDKGSYAFLSWLLFIFLFLTLLVSGVHEFWYFFYYRLYRRKYSFRYRVKMLEKQCQETEVDF